MAAILSASSGSTSVTLRACPVASRQAMPSVFIMAEIELELSPLLGGRKVDLRTAGDLNLCFRDEVVRTAEPQYETR